MGDGNHSDGRFLNLENQCIWETFEIQSDCSLLAGCANTGLFGCQLDDTTQFLRKRAGRYCTSIISIPSRRLFRFG